MNFLKQLLHQTKLELGPRPQLVQARPYIIPQSLGYGFALVILITVILGLNSKNNLIFLFAFFLFSIGQSVAVWTNRNLLPLHVRFQKARHCFANDATELVYEIENSKKSTSYNIEATVKTSLTMNSTPVFIEKINGRSKKEIRMSITFPRRGIYPAPSLRIESTFPFYFLRAWKFIKFEKQIIIAPMRKNHLQLGIDFYIKNEYQKTNPHFSLTQTALQQKYRSDTQEFSHHTPYQKYDNPKSIDWKRFAKTQNLLSKTYNSEVQNLPVELRWIDTESLPFEKRLEQFTYWIEEAFDKKTYVLIDAPFFKGTFEPHQQNHQRLIERLATYEA